MSILLAYLYMLSVIFFLNAFAEELFFKLIRESFNQRRKTLINNLSNTYSKDLITKMLNDFNIKPNVRSEELDIKTFVDFSNYILENGGEK